MGRRLTTGSWRRAAVRLGEPARAALHRDWALILFIIAAAAAALAAAIASRTLLHGTAGASPLGIAPFPATDAGIEWSDMAATVTASRLASLATLLDIVAVAGAGAALVGLVTVLAVAWMRSSARQHEVDIHRAVGATRATIAGSALVEGTAMLVPALLGGASLGWLGARKLLATWPGLVAGWAPVVLVPLILTAAILLASALLVLRHTRTRRLGGLPAGGLGLIPQVVQMALTLATLITATAVSRQAMLLIDEGGSSSGVARFVLDDAASDPVLRSANYAALLAGLSDDPAVTAASITSPGLALGLGEVDWLQTECGECRAAGIILRWHDVQAVHHVAGPDTFSVLGMPMLQGRTFTAADTRGARPVAIVNRNLALRHFQDGNPIGRVIYIGGVLSRVAYTVVGVVDDRQPPVLGSGAQPRDAVYLSIYQHPPATGELLILAKGPVAVPAVRPDLTVMPAGTLGELRRQEASLLDWFASTVRLGALLALVAAVLGAFVAMRNWSQSLQGELALRRALGAPAWRVLLVVGALALATVALAAVAARLFVAPSLAYLLAMLLRDPAPASFAAWTPTLLLAAAALAGALPPAFEVVRRAPARWLA